MKKFLITAFALMAGVSVAMAGMGISWSNGGGWMVENGADLDDGPGIAENNSVIWQLIYAGENNVADPVDVDAVSYLSGDDQLLASREIPAGGGTASSDNTVWTDFLMRKTGGNATYEDLDWAGTGDYVYQRIFQGAPTEGSFYFETELFEYNKSYVGGGQAADVFGYASGEGVEANRTVGGGQVPEPATMSLLGLGALAMVIRRKLRK